MKARSNDFMIRRELVRKLLETGIPRNHIRHETTLDSSSSDGRADLVVMRSERLIGVEIKSGVDTLARLAQQRPRYSARFDRIVLVCDAKHKPWDNGADYFGWQGWECCTATFDGENVSFGENYWNGLGALISPQFREIERSDYLAPRAMLQMLWANEIATLCKARGSEIDTRSRGIPFLAESYSMKELRAGVSAALIARQLNRWEEKFWTQFDAPLSNEAAA